MITGPSKPLKNLTTLTRGFNKICKKVYFFKNSSSSFECQKAKLPQMGQALMLLP